MNTILLEIPDDPSDWPSWLEGQLVNPDLSLLVEQLEIVFEPNPAGTITKTLAEILQDNETEVLSDGLAVLDRDRIAQLLQSPRTLLELQDKILLADSDHWDMLIPLSTPSQATRHQWHEINERIHDPIVAVSPPSKPPSGIKRWYLLSILSLAAALLLIVGVWKASQPTVQWGFANPAIALSTAKDGAYLELIADSADDWFNQPGDDREQLARKLAEFQVGCQQLIDSPHRQLSKPDDRIWIVGKCRAWSIAIAKLQNELKIGTTPTVDIQFAADEIIHKLQVAIREHANGIA